MTRPAAWLPYLILPLGVALLEYHGIQFWTTAVTGAWPGWFTGGFWAAWSAWGWAVLLEAGALWCWIESRVEDPWRSAGWVLAGGVLTVVLCVAALWNVAEPVRQNLAVSQLMDAERDRVGAQEQAAQGLLLRADKPYSRLLDNMLRSQARAAELFQDALTMAQDGRTTSERQGRIVLWLQIACVVLGQLLVVAAARAVGGTGVGQPRESDESADRYGHDQLDATEAERGEQPRRRGRGEDRRGFGHLWAYLERWVRGGGASGDGPAGSAARSDKAQHGQLNPEPWWGLERRNWATRRPVLHHGHIRVIKRGAHTIAQAWDDIRKTWGTDPPEPKDDAQKTAEAGSVHGSGAGTPGAQGISGAPADELAIGSRAQGVGDAAAAGTDGAERPGSDGLDGTILQQRGVLRAEAAQETPVGNGNAAPIAQETASQAPAETVANQLLAGVPEILKREPQPEPVLPIAPLEKPLPVERVAAVYRRIYDRFPGASCQGVADALMAALPEEARREPITKKLVWQLGKHAELLSKRGPTAGPAQLARVEAALQVLEQRR